MGCMHGLVNSSLQLPYNDYNMLCVSHTCCIRACCPESLCVIRMPVSGEGAPQIRITSADEGTGAAGG